MPLQIHLASDDPRVNEGWVSYEAALKAARAPWRVLFLLGLGAGAWLALCAGLWLLPSARERSAPRLDLLQSIRDHRMHGRCDADCVACKRKLQRPICNVLR